MSSIFGLWSSYMLEYCWLFALLLRSARYVPGVEGKWTPLPPMLPPSSSIDTFLKIVVPIIWAGLPIPSHSSPPDTHFSLQIKHLVCKVNIFITKKEGILCWLPTPCVYCVLGRRRQKRPDCVAQVEIDNWGKRWWVHFMLLRNQNQKPKALTPMSLQEWGGRVSYPHLCHNFLLFHLFVYQSISPLPDCKCLESYDHLCIHSPLAS